MPDDTTELKNVMSEIIQMIRDGDVPGELAELYERMKVEKFVFWLYGFCVAASRQKSIRESELCKFLKKEIASRL